MPDHKTDLLGRLRSLARLPLRLVPAGQVVPVLSGPLRGKRWIAGSATAASWLGIYERGVQHAFSRFVRPGDVVFDVGANVGFYTLLAAGLAGPKGRVVAFEPSSRNVEHLRRHLVLNAVENVDVLQVAVADTPGQGYLASSSSPAMGRLGASGEVVRLVALDELVASGEVAAPSFMKIDVEGAESRVLKGAEHTLARHHPTLMLAAHGWEQNQVCRALLGSLGYRIDELRDGARDGDYALLATI